MVLSVVINRSSFAHLGALLMVCGIGTNGRSAAITTTIYVGRHFEVRDHDQPIKYVFSGQTRVAEITGSLSANPRIQRLRLHAGWNLCSLAVQVTDLSSALEAAGIPTLNSVYQWSSSARQYSAVASGQTVANGSVLWVKSVTEALVGILGSYNDPPLVHVEAGGDYIPAAGLEAWSPGRPPAMDAWTFATPTRNWRVQLSGDLASASDPPLVLAPGDAMYASSDSPLDLQVPDPALRIRYYHPDHLGSPTAVTDAQGQLVQENSFYGFGQIRNEYLLRPFEEPYGFSQKERDRETRLHYCEARYLVSPLSRFLSPDPKFAAPDLLVPAEQQEFLTMPQALNLYAYVHNNPLKYVDPTGLDGKGLIIVGAGQEQLTQNMQDPGDKAFDAAIKGMFGAQMKGLNVTIKHVKSAAEMTQLLKSGSWDAVAYFGHGVVNDQALAPSGHADKSLSRADLAAALRAANPKNVYLMGCTAGWTGLARNLSADLPGTSVFGTFDILDVTWQRGQDAGGNKVNRMTPNQPFTEYQGGFRTENGKKATQRPRERGDPLVIDPNAPIDAPLPPVNQ